MRTLKPSRYVSEAELSAIMRQLHDAQAELSTLSSTLDREREEKEFYEWYWTANRSNHDRDEINTDYHQISGNDIPEEAWEE